MIHELRVGDYKLPDGSIVVGAGNRAQDSAIVKPMSSALLNRLIHVHLSVSHRDWLSWASDAGIHALVVEYIQARPDHLWTQPPKHEEPFSTPRSWHMLSDAITEYGDKMTDKELEVIAYGCLSPHHATQFKAFVKHLRNRYQLTAIIDGDDKWPSAPEDRDVLYFLAQSFRAQLIKQLPPTKESLSGSARQLAHNAKGSLKDLAEISLEIAQTVVANSEKGEEELPGWFLVEVVRDIPRIAAKRDK